MCSGCNRPSLVCICDELPRPPLRPSLPLLLLQHTREAARKLGSADLLRLSIDGELMQTVVGRTLGHVRRSAAWERYAHAEGRTPLLLFPSPCALSAAQVTARMEERGERFFLVAVDATWKEAKEICARNTASRHVEPSQDPPATKHETQAEEGSAPDPSCFERPIECLSLDPSEEGCSPLFAGCRKPLSPSHLCTLEAVALALRLLAPSRDDGDGLAEALLKPMRKMVAHQVALTNGREVHRVERPGYIPGLTEAAASAAKAVGGDVRP